MRHEALLPVAPPDKDHFGYSCYCSCGHGFIDFSKPRSAQKAAEAHARDKNAAEAVKARLVGHTPQRVIQAAWQIHGGHHSLGSVSWEAGTTVIVVLTGEGGTAAIRQTLSADLSEVLTSERVRAIQ